MHTMTDRIEDLGGRLRERRSNSKIEHLDKENDRLRTELRSIRSMLDRERSERDEMLDALKGRPKTVVKKKRGGLIRMIVIGGGAYVLGSRAGRARYEQIVEWAKRMRDRGREATDEFRADVVSADHRDDVASPTKGFGSTGSGTSGPASTGPTVASKTEAPSKAAKPASTTSADKQSGSTGS